MKGTQRAPHTARTRSLSQLAHWSLPTSQWSLSSASDKTMPTATTVLLHRGVQTERDGVARRLALDENIDGHQALGMTPTTITRAPATAAPRVQVPAHLRLVL